MYATLLLMSSTLGGDVAPAPGAVVPAGHVAGCNGVPAPAPCCDSGRPARASLLDRLHARHGSKSSCNDCCAPAPACAPAPVAAPCCDSGCQRANLMDKIRARGHHRKSDCCADSCAAPCAAPCATPGAPPVITPTPVTPPKVMPKPTPKTTGGKDEEASSAPAIPVPLPLPAVPSVPVAGNGTPY